MLVSLSLQNWMSYRTKSSISLIATKEKRHADLIPSIDKYKTKVLPLSIIYGGNGSGKSNLVKALRFVKEQVLMGARPTSAIPVNMFRLDQTSESEPTYFALEMFIDEKMYAFNFTVTQNAILEEKLVEISASTKKVLYDRFSGQVSFDASLQNEAFLQFVFNGTRDNQLFLNNAISQNVPHLLPVYDWFNQTLQVVTPSAPFDVHLQNTTVAAQAMTDALSRLDTGICHVEFQEVRLEELEVSREFLVTIAEKLTSENQFALVMLETPVAFSRKDGNLLAQRLITFHTNERGDFVNFGVKNESDGSKQIIHVLPIFLDLCSPVSNRVYIVDELERNLHPLLTSSLLEGYLSACSRRSRSQLLFTTYDVSLMESEFIRPDELWVTERSADGASSLISFSEYKDTWQDRDIQKSYLEGRLGGIPRLPVRTRLAHQ